MPPFHEELARWYKTHAEEILADYITFLKFPSISTDPHYSDAVRQTAHWLSDYLTKIGLQSEIWETKNHPVVFASHCHAGKDRPTLLIYHHYDVQPIEPRALWHSDPFLPVIKQNQIFARGASDNKGQCFYTITAIKAFLQLASPLYRNNFNLKLFIEGEEECGSSGTFALLPEKSEQLRADYLLIVDAGLPEKGVPAITLGSRGITTMHLEIENGSIDLHSGEHGGIALNPARALASMLSQLWDEKGKVQVPGFYDQVEKLSPEEQQLYDLDFDPIKYTKTFGVKAFAPEPGYSLIASNWLRPTLEINGIHSGYSGPGFKTVLPAQAVANLSARLVPHQDPEKIAQAIETFLRSCLPPHLSCKLSLHHGASAYRCPFPSRLATICSHAYEQIFKTRCKKVLCGGSIPITGELAKYSHAETLLMGLALASDDIHAPNEHFDLDQFEQGVLVMGVILHQLSADRYSI